MRRWGRMWKITKAKVLSCLLTQSKSFIFIPYNHTKEVMKRAMRKTIIIAGVAICIICAALISYGFMKFTQRDAIPSRDLTLSDYPNLFAKGAVIVIGENASQIEIESTEAIAAKRIYKESGHTKFYL